MVFFVMLAYYQYEGRGDPAFLWVAFLIYLVALITEVTRDHVPFASYLFFRYPNPRDGSGAVRTCEPMIAEAKSLKKPLNAIE